MCYTGGNGVQSKATQELEGGGKEEDLDAIGR